MSRTVPSRVLPILTVTDVRPSRVLPTSLKYRASDSLEDLISQLPPWPFKVVLSPQKVVVLRTNTKRIVLKTKRSEFFRNRRGVVKGIQQSRTTSMGKVKALISLAKNERILPIRSELVSHRHFYISQNNTSRQ